MKKLRDMKIDRLNGLKKIENKLNENLNSLHALMVKEIKTMKKLRSIKIDRIEED